MFDTSISSIDIFSFVDFTIYLRCKVYRKMVIKSICWDETFSNVFRIWSVYKVDDTVKLRYTDTRYNDKFLYTDNLTSTEPLSQEVTVNHKLSRSIIIQYFKQQMFWIFVRIAHRGDSNKYPKQTFYREIRIKYGVCCISFCSLRILYNSKFILMATSFGTNAVVVTRVHCNCFWLGTLRKHAYSNI